MKLARVLAELTSELEQASKAHSVAEVLPRRRAGKHDLVKRNAPVVPRAVDFHDLPDRCRSEEVNDVPINWH